MPSSNKHLLISERFQKPLAFLDLVFGATYSLLTVLAVVLWIQGKGSWHAVAVLVFYIAVNTVLSKFTQQASRPILVEATRTASAFVLGPLVFVYTAIPFDHWWPVFASYCIGNVSIWGLLTGRVLWGRLLVLYYVGLYVFSVWLVSDGMDWNTVFANSAVLAMAGLIFAELLPFVAQIFQRELEQAREIEKAYHDLEEAHTELKSTQAQLIQAEKMASLGSLTAGIAHEIKNPLNFVNNFAQLSTELTDELTSELNAHPDKTVAQIRTDLDELLADLRFNTEKIEEHGKRADGIVRAMMDHARGGGSERRSVKVNALVEEYVNLAFHGKRANTPDFNVSLERDYDEAVGEVDMIPEEIGRVFINLLNNAFDAVHERATAAPEHVPKVHVSTRRKDESIEIRIADNGTGIPEALQQKIFEPFFTTKPTGSGTGLGLSLSFDIITQGHNGTLMLESEEGQGTTFIVTLPMNPQ